ncbi:MAG TPA: hypothetical protein VGM53_31155 [Streptosporangiaceae bacterium]
MTAPFPPEPDRDILESSPRWERAVSLLERVPRWLMLTAAALLLAGGGTWLAVGHGGSARPSPVRPVVRTVPVPASCGQYDNGASRHVQRGYRTVFGDVAVPPAYLPVGASGRGELWEYGAKAAFFYRGGGPPVTISVPAGWQRQIGLFGPPNGIAGTARTLHIPSCPPRGSWDFYVSSFYMSTPTACAPLDVRVGGRIAQFWFGLGARCPAGADTGPRIPTDRISAAP